MNKIMQILSIGILATVLFQASAQAKTIQNQRMVIRGVVQFEKTYTMTCMAIGCPPSEPYFYLTLTNTNSSIVEKVYDESIRTELGILAKPTALNYEKLQLKEGDTLVIDADFSVIENLNMAYVTKINSIEKL